MFRIAILVALIAAGCSSPPSKDPNSSANVNPNNVNSVNGMPNNLNNTNSTNNSTNSTFVDPGDYDQTCEFDYECEMVWGGDICGCGSICGDAIAVAAVPEFQRDVEAVMCPPNADPVACPGAACQEQMAVCSNGDCEAATVRTIDASEFDQGCEIDADCVAISTGVICSACDCERGAISVSALPDYEAIREEVDCNPGPSPCDCAAPDQAWCDAGVCDVRFGD